MILGFSQTINNKPSLFAEKINLGLIDKADFFKRDLLYNFSYTDLQKKHPELKPESYFKHILPKFHTIREDKNDRWHPGRKIHFSYNVRKSNYFRFAPVIECTAIQEIEIKYTGEYFGVIIDGITTYVSHEFCLVDDKIKMKQLARYDGFDGIASFFNYFNKDFKGKIIHWTDIRY